MNEIQIMSSVAESGRIVGGEIRSLVNVRDLHEGLCGGNNPSIYFLLH